MGCMKQVIEHAAEPCRSMGKTTSEQCDEPKFMMEFANSIIQSQPDWKLCFGFKLAFAEACKF